MQNSNPSQNPDSLLFLDPAIAAAYQRAKETAGGAEPSARDFFAALGATPDARPGGTSSARHADPADPGDDTEPDLAVPRLDLDQLLRVFRGPIDWVLSVAYLRTEDAIDEASVNDLGAITRVRNAIQRRHTPGSPAPAPIDQEAPLRTSDLLVVIERLFGKIDPSLVVRAARAFTHGVTEALRQMIQLYPVIMSLLAPTTAPQAERTDPRAPGIACDDGACSVPPSVGTPYATGYYVPPYAPRFRCFVPCSHVTPPGDPYADILRALFAR